MSDTHTSSPSGPGLKTVMKADLERPRSRDSDEFAGQRASGACAAAGDGGAPVPVRGATRRTPAAIRVRRGAARRRHSAGNRVGGPGIHGHGRTRPGGATGVGDDTAERGRQARGIGGSDVGRIDQRILRGGGDRGREFDLLAVNPPEIDDAREQDQHHGRDQRQFHRGRAVAAPKQRPTPWLARVAVHCTSTTVPPLEPPPRPEQVEARADPPESVMVEPMSSRHCPAPLPTFPAPLRVIGALGK